jgi:hypothetical protein
MGQLGVDTMKAAYIFLKHLLTTTQVAKLTHIEQAIDFIAREGVPGSFP